MGKDARNAQRKEQEWLAREATQRCPQCGRRFIRRSPGEVCSIACAELEKKKANASQ